MAQVTLKVLVVASVLALCYGSSYAPSSSSKTCSAACAGKSCSTAISYTPFQYIHPDLSASFVEPEPSFDNFGNGGYPGLDQACFLQGLPRDFDTLPTIPSASDPLWTDCGPDTGLECPSGANIGILGSTPSRLLTACDETGDEFVGGTEGSPCNFLTYLDYTFFQTTVTVPSCQVGTPFIIQYFNNTLDDAANVYVFNCKYPNGTLAAHNSICCCGCPAITDPGNSNYCATPDISGFLVAGANRIVIAHVDDFVSFRGIQLNFVACGTTLAPTCPASTNPCATVTFNATLTQCVTTSKVNGTKCTTASYADGTCKNGQCVKKPKKTLHHEDDDDDDDDHHRRHDDDDDDEYYRRHDDDDYHHHYHY